MAPILNVRTREKANPDRFKVPRWHSAKLLDSHARQGDVGEVRHGPDDLTASLKERAAHKLNLQDTSSLSFMYLYDEEQYRLEDGRSRIAHSSR